MTTFHWGSQQTGFVATGNLTSALTLDKATAFQGRAFVSAVQVAASERQRGVIVLGDSITDGNGSTPDSNRRWPDYLARLTSGSGIAVANAGISGARLLRDGMGVKASARFDDDVLDQPGVTSVVVALGVNDICWPGTPFAPAEIRPTVADLITGYRQLISAARARHVRIIGATITPFQGALPDTPFAGLYDTPAKEALRQQVNLWIRDSGAFDAVVDFDAVVRDPRQPARLLAKFDSGDHLHPGDAGYAAMAGALNTDILFGR
ncbi:putative secreted protein [Oxalobacteraceae bacterium IMCC9480]|nr:putative secreted protein [Oxalobacteraceae bacterium IMCC9480]